MEPESFKPKPPLLAEYPVARGQYLADSQAMSPDEAFRSTPTTDPLNSSQASQALKTTKDLLSQKPVPQSSKTFSIIMLALITVVGIALLIWFDMDDITAFIEANPTWVVGISLFVFAILGFTIIPSTPISIVLAVVMGPWQAVLWGMVGMTLASLIEYFVARQFCDVFDLENWRQKLPKFWRELPLDSVVTLIFGRFLPGPKVIALGAATLRVPMFKYIWTSLVSNLLGNVIVVLAFSGILKLPWGGA